MQFIPTLVAVAFSLFVANAFAFDLLSNSEWSAEQVEQAKPHSPKRGFGVKPANAFPKILVQSPTSFESVPSPITIAVKFDGGGHNVNPDSFKVLYGWLKLDITDRLKSAVKIDPTGFSISGADLPEGSHSLLLRISDVDGHESTTEVSFKVTK